MWLLCDHPLVASVSFAWAWEYWAILRRLCKSRLTSFYCSVLMCHSVNVGFLMPLSQIPQFLWVICSRHLRHSQHLYQVTACIYLPMLLPQCATLNIPVRPLTKSSDLKITDSPRKMPPCSPVVWIYRLTTTVRKDCFPKFNSDRFWRTTVPVWKVRARVHFVLCGLPGLHRTVNVLRKHRVCAACCCIVLECWLCI